MVVDAESAEWLRALQGPERDKAAAELHEMLLRIARREVHRRDTAGQVTGPELGDVAHQAAADALMLVMKKLQQFRGQSRFTTWAYKFVMFEVSTNSPVISGGAHALRTTILNGTACRTASVSCRPSRPKPVSCSRRCGGPSRGR